MLSSPLKWGLWWTPHFAMNSLHFFKRGDERLSRTGAYVTRPPWLLLGHRLSFSKRFMVARLASKACSYFVRMHHHCGVVVPATIRVSLWFRKNWAIGRNWNWVSSSICVILWCGVVPAARVLVGGMINCLIQGRLRWSIGSYKSVPHSNSTE